MKSPPGNNVRYEALILALMLGLAVTASAGEATPGKYADPVEPALPQTSVDVSLSDTALVITDPQIDFLSPEGVTWGEVVVVRDATAAARLPEGDGYLAAITNFRYVANDLWTTEEAVSKIKSAQ